MNDTMQQWFHLLLVTGSSSMLSTGMSSLALRFLPPAAAFFSPPTAFFLGVGFGVVALASEEAPPTGLPSSSSSAPASLSFLRVRRW